MSENDLRQKKTVFDIKEASWKNIIDSLESSPENEWENIANYFEKYFKQPDIAKIRAESRKLNVIPSEIVLRTLRNNLVTIKEVYKCFVELELVHAYNILEIDFPEEVKYIKTQQTTNSQTETSLNNNNINIGSNINGLQQIKQSESSENSDVQLSKNICLSAISNQNQLSNFQANQSQQIEQTNFLLGVKTLIELYEEILPVIHEDKLENDPITISSFSFLQLENKLPVNLRVFGKFEICYIKERKLSFKKREFDNPFDYLRELKMIKHRHLNLYIAECILKIAHCQNYFLLYHNDVYPTKLLTEYASQNLNNLNPSQYNTLIQLTILKDIACGLTYLHDKSEFKKIAILHGNLQPDCILIELKSKEQISAKIFDFTNSIELNDSENFEAKIREEFYQFGLIIFLVTTWRYLTKFECDAIHNEHYEDINQYQYTLYCRYGMDKNPNPIISQTLLKMFFAITTSNYNIQKGIKRSYDNIKDWLEKLNADKK